MSADTSTEAVEAYAASLEQIASFDYTLTDEKLPADILQCLTESTALLRALVAERDALKKDAERYKLVRNKNMCQVCVAEPHSEFGNTWNMYWADGLDNALDAIAARSEAKP